MVGKVVAREAAREEDSVVDLAAVKVEEDSAVDLAAVKVEEDSAVDLAGAKVAARADNNRRCIHTCLPGSSSHTCISY